MALFFVKQKTTKSDKIEQKQLREPTESPNGNCPSLHFAILLIFFPLFLFLYREDED